MDESKPSYRQPCIFVEGQTEVSLFTANYDAMMRQSAENGVNLGSSSAPIFISYNAASAKRAIRVLKAYAYVIDGDARQPWLIRRPAADEPKVPVDAERLLAWITKPDRLEFVLDTFEVNFRRRVLRDGEFAAQQWYRWQVARTLGESVFQLSPRIASFVYLVRRIVSFVFGS
jgi:hypothetical protein